MVNGVIRASLFFLPTYMIPESAEVLYELMLVDRPVSRVHATLSVPSICWARCDPRYQTSGEFLDPDLEPDRHQNLTGWSLGATVNIISSKSSVKMWYTRQKGSWSLPKSIQFWSMPNHSTKFVKALSIAFDSSSWQTNGRGDIASLFCVAFLHYTIQLMCYFWFLLLFPIWLMHKS